MKIKIQQVRFHLWGFFGSIEKQLYLSSSVFDKKNKHSCLHIAPYRLNIYTLRMRIFSTNATLVLNKSKK